MIKFPADAEIPIKGTVKFGIDPTFPRLHLGHLVPLRVVRQMLQDGHPTTIVLGTFTAQLGDPSGRDTTRPILSKKEVEDNANQIEKLVRHLLPKKVKFWRNGDLHNNTPLPEFMKLVASFTVSKMMSRNAFQLREQNGHAIGLHELLVPICQGMDSVHLFTEIEIGGQDQLFNFQLTRELQELHGIAGQVSLLTPIIRGTDGRKMSKSYNNCIWLDDNPIDMFGKAMSIPDDVMMEWLPLLTDNTVSWQDHPMEKKLNLAFAITEQLHGNEEAFRARDHFKNTIQNKQPPAEMPIITAHTLVDAVVSIRDCSKNEARRLIVAGGVTVDEIKSTKDKLVTTGQIVKVGKLNFAKIS